MKIIEKNYELLRDGINTELHKDEFREDVIEYLNQRYFFLRKLDFDSTKMKDSKLKAYMFYYDEIVDNARLTNWYGEHIEDYSDHTFPLTNLAVFKNDVETNYCLAAEFDDCYLLVKATDRDVLYVYFRKIIAALFELLVISSTEDDYAAIVKETEQLIKEYENDCDRKAVKYNYNDAHIQYEYLYSLLLSLRSLKDSIDTIKFQYNRKCSDVSRTYLKYVYTNLTAEIIDLIERGEKTLEKQFDKVADELPKLFKDLDRIIHLFNVNKVLSSEFVETDYLLPCNNEDTYFIDKSISNYTYESTGLTLNNMNYCMQMINPDDVENFKGDVYYNANMIRGYRVNFDKLSVTKEYFKREEANDYVDKLFERFLQSEYQTLPVDVDILGRESYKRESQMVEWHRLTPGYFINNGVFYYTEEKACFSHIYNNMLMTVSCPLSPDYDEYELMMRWYNFFLIDCVEYVSRNGLSKYVQSSQCSAWLRLDSLKYVYEKNREEFTNYSQYNTQINKSKTIAGFLEYWLGILKLGEIDELNIKENELNDIYNLMNALFLKMFDFTLSYDCMFDDLEMDILSSETNKLLSDYCFDHFPPSWREDVTQQM